MTDTPDYYISGPMRGHFRYNFDAFFEAEKKLAAEGYTCINPARLDMEEARIQGRPTPYDLPDDYDWDQWPEWLDKTATMGRDRGGVELCKGIYMLPIWEQSLGACDEYHHAKFLGKEIRYHEEPKPEPGSAEWRKRRPVWSGVLNYFPDAVVALQNLRREELLREEKGWVRPHNHHSLAYYLGHHLPLVGQRNENPFGNTCAHRHSAHLANLTLHLLQKEIEEAGEALDMPEDRNSYMPVFHDFPDALMEVAHASWVGNEQHNPGEPLHWSRHKSSDHIDCAVRHLIEAGKIDSDGVRHSAKAAWRALAVLQLEIESERKEG